MANPTAVNESYYNCQGYTVTVGGQAVATVESGGFSHEYKTDDMTNQSGGGGEEDVKTTYSASGTIVVAWPTGGVPNIVPGNIYALVLDPGDYNRPYLSCNARFPKFDAPVLDPTKGMKNTFSFKSQGAVNRTRP